MDIIIRRNNSPETRRLVEERNVQSRPGTLRRRYDHQMRRNIFAPSAQNKRSRKEIADTDAKLIRRANKIGGGYQPIVIEEEQENRKNMGRRRNRTSSRDRRRQCDYGARQFINRGFDKIQYRW